MHSLVQKAIFEGKTADILPKIRQTALKRGVFLSSLSHFYEKIAKGDYEGFSVPAFNLRALTFDMARAIFRAAKKEKAGYFIFELASSEMEYTRQTPQDFCVCVLAAAVEEKYKGKVFLQADHLYLKDTSEKSIYGLKDLILQAFSAGFYNFEIDCSALSLAENISQTNNFCEFIKKNQPKGIAAALGGEVSSIGGKETTEQELDTFLKGVDGLLKVSCQTGTRHGGNVLASGEVAPTEIDFEKIKNLGKIARQYGLAGIVQHGASTLQNEQFSQLVEAGVLEVHLSTLFQNIILDSVYFPKETKEKIYSYLEQNFQEERKNYQSDKQFFYCLRKKALGVFKKQIWQMPKKNLDGICQELEEKFRFFFGTLKVSGVD